MVYFGSPPRAWGQCLSAARKVRVARFTPTGVGTMSQAYGRPRGRAVHPHGRGDNDERGRVTLPPVGSPPRAWGQCRPAGVTTHHLPVHPHGRGDNRMPFHRVSAMLGSPPRAWGQSVIRRETRLRTRFTPTGVGTICQSPSWSLVLSVHPHGRGDNGAVNGVPDGASGSPPRAWGQCHRHHSMRRARRFTPTGVGTMIRRSCCISSVSVHPHGRGDN